MDSVKIPIIRIEQPIGDFYVGTIDALQLVEMSKSDMRKIEVGTSDYIGIQRPLDLKRVELISQYIDTVDSSFPNSIILNIEKKNLVMYSDSIMEVKRTQETFSIIDGQHRLAEFRDKKSIDFKLIVTIFVDLELDQRARVFSIINSEQKQVNKSHSFDLESLSPVDTPRKLCRYIANTFNIVHSSPWYQMIKMTGGKDSLSPKGIITQKAFVDPILDFMYPDIEYEIIRSKLIEGELLPDYDTKRYFLWNYFKENKQEILYKVLQNYFNALKATFPSKWGDQKSILNKSVGYKAIMDLFKDIYLIGLSINDLSEDHFKKYLSKAKPLEDKLTSEFYASSLQGARSLYKDFHKQIDLRT